MSDSDLRHLHAHVQDLADRYDEGQAHGPGLLHQLETADAHLTSYSSRTRPRKHPPAPRTPLRVDLLDLAQAIRAGAQEYATALGAPHTRDGLDALRRLPTLTAGLDPDEPLRRAVCNRVAKWHHTCRVALAYTNPARTPPITCPYCRRESLTVRFDLGRIHCLTAWCVDADGLPPVWDIRQGLWNHVQ